jgi:hypothetical protein
MNSDEINPGPSAAGNASPKPDSASNLKGRRGRGPARPSGLGPVSPVIAKATTFGIVTDLAGARESLSGQHARGYVGGVESEERREPVQERVEEFRDETVREDRRERRETAPPPPAVEAFRDEEVREPRRERSEERRAQRPAPPVEGFRDEAVWPPRPERPQPAGAPRPPPVEGYRDEPVRDRRERDQPARERREQPPERGPFRRRGESNEPDGGQRNEYINLMPDPANDAAPRRLRTETANPPPRVEDYAPSRSARVPDKVVPLDRRQRAQDGSAGGKERPKAHATIDISRRSEGATRPAGSGGGLLSMIKRVLGFGERPAKAEPKVETPRPASNDEARHGSGGEREAGRDGQGDGERHRRRRRGGRGRGGRSHGSDGQSHSGQP